MPSVRGEQEESLDGRSAAQGACNHGDDKQQQENEEEDLRDPCRSTGDPAEAKRSRDQRDDKKGEGPTEHDGLLFRFQGGR